jgi:hypothetical protein
MLNNALPICVDLPAKVQYRVPVCHSLLELIFVYVILNNASPIFVDLLAEVQCRFRVCHNLLELIIVELY